MITNSRTKNNIIANILFAAVLFFIPASHMHAQECNDDFGAWGTFEFSQKVNKKTKFVIDAEIRSIEAVSEIERIAIGAKLDYKIKEWKDLGENNSQIELKTNIGYSFIYGHNLSEKSLKEFVADADEYDYNIDHAYWAVKNRAYFTLTGEFKVGRFEISLRERLQYTHTGSATTEETKYRWEYSDKEEDFICNEEKKNELKEAKDNLALRSRLSIKYDIPNCKVNPFISAELYTRLDKWQTFDKARYRAGATYKINKKNSISLYYLYQDVSGNDPNGHAVGFEYSIDL